MSEKKGNYAAEDLLMKPVRRMQCYQSAVRSVRFNCDSLYCMTAGGDKTIKLWNPYDCRALKTYCGHVGEVLDVDVRIFFV